MESYHEPNPASRADERQRATFVLTGDNRWIMLRHIGQRDGYHCHYCGIPLRREDGTRYPYLYRVGVVGGRIVSLVHAVCQIDHKTPSCHGGSDDVANLVLACRHCNAHKQSTPYDQYLQWMNEWKMRAYWPAILHEILFQCGEVQR